MSWHHLAGFRVSSDSRGQLSRWAGRMEAQMTAHSSHDGRVQEGQAGAGEGQWALGSVCQNAAASL